MSITNYTELQASIASWLHRDDLTAFIPDFIALAEVQLSTDVTAREMETRLPITITAANPYFSLPNDMVEMRRLRLNTEPYQVLKYATPDEIDEDYGTSASQRPAVFTVIGTQAQVAPIPDADYTGELTYKQRIPALSSTNATNWLLTLYPNVYLFASLSAAAIWAESDDADLAKWTTFYQAGINAINNIEWYSGTTLRVRAR